MRYITVQIHTFQKTAVSLLTPCLCSIHQQAKGLVRQRRLERCHHCWLHDVLPPACKYRSTTTHKHHYHQIRSPDLGDWSPLRSVRHPRPVILLRVPNE